MEMTWSTIIIEVLRLIISWPFVIGALGFTFGFVFREEIAQFIKSIAAIRFPGGAEIRANQPPPPAEPAGVAPPTSDGETIALTAQQIDIVRKHIESLTEKAEKAKNAAEEKEQVVKAAVDMVVEKHKEVIHWWFQYLSLFLVPMTQIVLKWFATQAVAPTKEYYDEFWKVIVSDTKERQAILMALLHHHLLEANGPVFQITQTGHDFLGFMEGKGQYINPYANQ